MGIPRYPVLYKGTVGGQYKVPTLSGGAKAATCPAADNRGGRWASCTTGRQHAQCARFTIIVHIISSYKMCTFNTFLCSRTTMDQLM